MCAFLVSFPALKEKLKNLVTAVTNVHGYLKNGHAAKSVRHFDYRAAIVDSVYSTFPKNEQTLILCDNYGDAGAINYYGGNIQQRAVSLSAATTRSFFYPLPDIN